MPSKGRTLEIRAKRLQLDTATDKFCIKCQQVRTRSSYDKCTKNTPDGYYPVCKECRYAYRVERGRDPKVREQLKYKHLERNYNMTKDDLDKMVIAQNHKCAICEIEVKNFNPIKAKGQGRYFAVDHNHKTGKVRGLLCNLCNSGIGHLQDSVCVLEKAIVYLKKYQES